MTAVHISKAGELPLINLLRFKGKPIFDQLILEEKLLRRSSDNWFIVNDGTNHPTIISGLAGKLSQLIDVEKVINDGIPVIRRFSGGGTVIVDKGTIFVTFICNKGAVDQLLKYEEQFVHWQLVLGTPISYIYIKLKHVYPTLGLLERNHINFLCMMRSILPSRSEFIRKTISALENHFCIKPMDFDEIKTDTNVEHHYSTKLMTSEDLEKALASYLSFGTN